MLSHQFQNTVNQRVTPQVTQRAQRYLTAQMRLPIRVASGATERTFAGNFDREQRDVAGQDAPQAERISREVRLGLGICTGADVIIRRWDARHR